MTVKKDKSQQERAEYKAKIARKERELDDFQKSKRTLEQGGNNINDTLNSGYGRLRELQESYRRWGVSTDKQIEADARKATEARKLLVDQNEEINQFFSQAKKQKLSEIDELEKEKRLLPWD